MKFELRYTAEAGGLFMGPSTFLAGKRALQVGAAAAVAMGTLPMTPVQAQEVVVIREVPERYAQLPGAGEALTVQTAPAVDVWSGLNPGQPLSDDEANAVIGRSAAGDGAAGVMGTLEQFRADRTELGPANLDRGGAAQAGIGSIVGQALDSSLGSMKTGLDQIQSALGPR